MEAFFRLAQVLPLSQAVLDQAVTLRRQRKMSLGDALVAGTALVHGLTLVTRNVEDFQWIQGLLLLNPFDTEPPRRRTICSVHPKTSMTSVRGRAIPSR